MRDNKTSQSAQKYDCNIGKTIPYYQCLHDETINLVRTITSAPQSWLDTGCGTGTLISQAIDCFTEAHFVLADPAEAMLKIAQEKFYLNERMKFVAAGTEELNYLAESFNVITAILSHHYLDFQTRQRATENCYRMLRNGGIYITFESILPTTERGTKIGLERWKDAQLKNGKSLEAVEKHLERFGSELLPISIENHLGILRNSGFSAVEIFWLSGMQAGFYAIK